MLLFHNLDEDDTAAVKAFRLFVKERLYRFNYVRPLLPPSPLLLSSPSSSPLQAHPTFMSLGEIGAPLPNETLRTQVQARRDVRVSHRGLLAYPRSGIRIDLVTLVPVGLYIECNDHHAQPASI